MCPSCVDSGPERWRRRGPLHPSGVTILAPLGRHVAATPVPWDCAELARRAGNHPGDVDGTRHEVEVAAACIVAVAHLRQQLEINETLGHRVPPVPGAPRRAGCAWRSPQRPSGWVCRSPRTSPFRTTSWRPSPLGTLAPTSPDPRPAPPGPDLGRGSIHDPPLRRTCDRTVHMGRDARLPIASGRRRLATGGGSDGRAGVDRDRRRRHPRFPEWMFPDWVHTTPLRRSAMEQVKGRRSVERAPPPCLRGEAARPVTTRQEAGAPSSIAKGLRPTGPGRKRSGGRIGPAATPRSVDVTGRQPSPCRTPPNAGISTWTSSCPTRTSGNGTGDQTGEVLSVRSAPKRRRAGPAGRARPGPRRSPTPATRSGASDGRCRARPGR